MIEIREYRHSDRSQLIQWVNQLQDYLISLDPINRLRREPDYGEVFFGSKLAQIRENNGKIFIAINHSVALGFVSGIVEEQSNKNLLEIVPTKLGVVTDLYVEQAARNQGIGLKLIDQMEQYLQSQGCDTLWVNVVAFNPALNFYKRRKYVEREIGMIKQI